jgi:predicted membrane-bound dolichyl-phosphate-mannose-protein mannosyltransferase
VAWLLHLHDRPILALASLVLALLSKESAVTFLPLVLAGDYARGKLKPLSLSVCRSRLAKPY